MVDRTWFTWRRLAIGFGIMVLATVVLVWAWWTAPFRELAGTLDEVRLPDGLVFLGIETQGDRSCFFDNCPRLTRYYGSDMEPDELCAVVSNEFPEVEEGRVGSVCVAQLEDLVGHAAFLQVREPISEIPPENDNELIEARPVEIPHQSVLYLTIRD